MHIYTLQLTRGASAIFACFTWALGNLGDRALTVGAILPPMCGCPLYSLYVAKTFRFTLSSYTNVTNTKSPPLLSHVKFPHARCVVSRVTTPPDSIW